MLTIDIGPGEVGREPRKRGQAFGKFVEPSLEGAIVLRARVREPVNRPGFAIRNLLQEGFQRAASSGSIFPEHPSRLRGKVQLHDHRVLR